MTLTDFLLARIAEDEAAAREASPGGWQYGTVESVAGGSLYDETRMIGSLHYQQPGEYGRIVRHLPSAEADANGAHIARHDPARVLAECEARRRIVAYADTMTQLDRDPSRTRTGDAWVMLTALALPFVDHPDFDESWRP